VRTRNDVALYVLNHKRGHLRDLENGFKVSLSVVSDPNVSGQQSYVIDRGEQVHTLEAAKALIAAQAAAHPMHGEETADEDEVVDAELESEVETEETEGLTEEAGDAGDGEAEQEGGGQRRGKRRRRRRGRGGEREAREGSQPREDGEAAVAEQGAEAQADEGEAEEDESEEQPGFARGDNQNGERRPRRRGRRGGRRRRSGGEREDGLVGSIGDELAPPQPSEAEIAVADFDGGTAEPAPSIAQPEPVAASQPSLQPEDHVAQAPASDEPNHESEKAARRRSTVREKVSFSSSAPSEAPAPATQSQEPVAGASAEPAAESNGENQPRKAGWWSRRFGGGE
jgi:ribonuclease E